MRSGNRAELFPPDRILQLRMAVALLVSLVCSASVIAALAWLWTVQLAFAFVASMILVCGWMRVLRGRPVAERDGPALQRVERHVERLSALAGLPAPRARVVDDNVPLSWTTALPSRRPTITVTSAMEQLCDDDALEAVIAHELGHVINGDAWVMTLVGGPPTWMLAGLRDIFMENKRGSQSVFGALAFGTFPLLISMPGALTARIVSRQRELSADRTAATLTGSPAGVAAALTRISQGVERAPILDLRAAAARDLFYFLPARPDEPSGASRLWATHPSIKRRLAQLDRMERHLHRAR